MDVEPARKEKEVVEAVVDNSESNIKVLDQE